MPRKKVILIIVEGISDNIALSSPLKKIFKNEQTYIHAINGDITTSNGNNASNIEKKLTDLIDEFSKPKKFKRSDFKEVIHIVDTDGAFIDNNLIVNDISIDKLSYFTDKIIAPSKTNIEQRNLQKSNNLKKLSSINHICKIPYSIYYMSCNLDHVLYDKINNGKDDKRTCAFQFATTYKNDTKGFISFITKSDFAVIDDYTSSWDFIMLNNNSLKRNSNLGLLFKNIDIV